MLKTVTVRQTGTSISATIPREIADKLHIEVGDQLFAIELSDGVLLTPYDQTVDAAMRAYDRIAKKHRNALRELAR